MKGLVKLFICMLLFNAIVFGCKPSKQDEGLPSCINSKIDVIKKEPVQNPPAKVWKWETESKTYYYFNAACCDQFSMLFNQNCEMICAPDGGFTGKGDGKCPEFTNDTTRSLIWEDDRKS